MDSKTLIAQVIREQGYNWENSDMMAGSETMLEGIVTHLETCQDCCTAFDAQDYSEEHLIEFEPHIQNSELSDWICGGLE